MRWKRDRESGPEAAPDTEPVKIPHWMRDQELPPEVHQVETGPNFGVGPGVVKFPAADGYHFGDDHPWGEEQQSALVSSLEELEKTIPSG